MIGDKKLSLEWYALTLEKTVDLGVRVDIQMSVLRLAFSLNDMPLIRKKLDHAKRYARPRAILRNITCEG